MSGLEAATGINLRAARRDGGTEALEEAVAQLFVEWRLPVYRYLLGVIAQSSLAEDLTQEVFVRLFLDLKKGHEIENIRAWLFRVAHNLAMDQTRRDARLRPLDESESESHTDPAQPVDQELLERDSRQALLATLSPQERRCMELRTEGLRYREIGEILGIRIPTVQTLLGRAVKKLVDANHD